MTSDSKPLDPASDLPSKAFASDVPPFGDQPGLPLIWPRDMQPAIDEGIRYVTEWLDDASYGYLWTSFLRGRMAQPSAMEKTAFEIAFLTRLQQHLQRMPRPHTTQ